MTTKNHNPYISDVNFKRIIRAMLEILISRLSDKLHGG